ncbi:putative Thaumatin family [Plasmopara halstedii]
MTCAAASACIFAGILISANAFTVTITNKCSSTIDLYTRLANVYTDEIDIIVPGGSINKSIGKGYEGHFRNGSNDAATLVEISTMGELDLTWYDIGIIPPRLHPDHINCMGLQECKDHSDSGIGFNTPVQITPTSNIGKDACEQLECLADECQDAYNFPTDDKKTHSCAFGTDLIVTFCPMSESVSISQDSPVQQETDSVPDTMEAPAAPDSNSNEDQTQNDDVIENSDTMATEVINSTTSTPTPNDVNQSENPSVEVTPEFTTATPTSKFCV